MVNALAYSQIVYYTKKFFNFEPRWPTELQLHHKRHTGGIVIKLFWVGIKASTGVLRSSGVQNVTVRKQLIMLLFTLKKYDNVPWIITKIKKTPMVQPMEQRTLKIVNNHLNMNFYSYLETSGGQSSDLYFNVVHFFNTSVNQTSVAA